MTCPTPSKEPLTKREANAVIRDMQRRTTHRSKRRFSPVEAYECPCGSFHLTTKRKRRFTQY